MRVIAAVMPMVALVVALGCSRSSDRRASDVYAAPEVPPPSSTWVNPPSAIGGGPPAEFAPDAALTPTLPTFELDANAVLAEPPMAPEKGDAQADGPSGGTFGASSDDNSPGAPYVKEGSAGVAP